MKAGLLAAAASVAALAAGGFAGYTYLQLDETRRELAGARGLLDKAKTELKTLQAEAETLRKQAAAQKISLEQAQADLNAARQFLESERAASARLREELGMAMAMARAAQSGRAAAAQGLPPSALPQLAPQRPMEVRIAPGGGARAVGAGAPAR